MSRTNKGMTLVVMPLFFVVLSNLYTMIHEYDITNKRKSVLVLENGTRQMCYISEGTVAIVAKSETEKWATIYAIETKSDKRNQGYASQMLEYLKDKYKDYNFGCTVALNNTMKHLLEKHQIKEYN